MDLGNNGKLNYVELGLFYNAYQSIADTSNFFNVTIGFLYTNAHYNYPLGNGKTIKKSEITSNSLGLEFSMTWLRKISKKFSIGLFESIELDLSKNSLNIFTNENDNENRLVLMEVANDANIQKLAKS